jgi:hypothetical protein
MKIVKLTLILALIPVIVTGCASSGEDLLKRRGQPEAQISKSQADQFDRQRDQDSKERDYQNATQQSDINTFNSFANEGLSLLNVAKGLCR